MHAKMYSDDASPHETASSPAGERPAYFVQSPPHAEAEKMSTGSGFSPVGAPAGSQQQRGRRVSAFESSYHHSRESSATSRFSEPLKSQNPRSYAGYSTLELHQGRPIVGHDVDYYYDDDDMDRPDDRRGRKVRFYACLVLAFASAFTLFCLILWGTSKSFTPKITLQGIVFESLNVQAGNDDSGVPTDMLTMNSTVRILYRNPATFFAVHVTSSPLELSYSQLILASGQMEEFSQPRKSERVIETNVEGDQVPLYGGVPVLYTQRTRPDRVYLPMNLTFTFRSHAYILGRLVTSKFYSRIRCTLTFRGNNLGKNVDLSNSCSVHR